MDTTNVALEVGERQDFHGVANSDSQLNPAAKRLILSAHLNLVIKKLRRGLSVEQQEILQMLPFTIPDGSQPDDETPDVEVWNAEDETWARRVAVATR